MLSLSQLDEFLRDGGVLLLPNHHGAQQWQDLLGQWHCQQLNTRVVEAPAIYAVDLWLRQLWQTLALQCNAAEFGWRVLAPAEEELLWQHYLDRQTTTTLLNTAGTARQLREASAQLQLWQVSLAELRQYLPWQEGDDGAQADTVIAWRWLQGFDQGCRKQQWLAGNAWLAQLLTLLREHAAVAAAVLPRKLLWLGFDDPPPLYRALQLQLRELGVESLEEQHTLASAQRNAYSFADTAGELRAAAEWCQRILHDDPLARIGIVCPALYSLAPALLRIFRQHLPPQELYCSVTPTLATHAFFNTAMQSLRLGDPHCDSSELCQWLRSPWLRGADDEAAARTALELRLRRQGELQTQTGALREYCQQGEQRWHCPVLGKALLELHALALRHKQPQPLAAWVAVFLQHWQQLLQLEQLQTPSLRVLAAAWQRWLDSAQTATQLFGPLTRQQAISTLLALARSTPLPNTRGNAGVRILTPVEAAGLHFTHLWVLQLHADAWPAALHPNPLLPLRLQRERNMPAANPQLELERAERQWQRWHQSSSVALVLSHPRQLDDLDVEPAAPLRDLSVTIIEEPALPAALHPALAIFPPRQTVLQAEPGLLPPADDQLQGPGSLLTAQALCPFKAFATHRLAARELPAFQLGLQASAVGELVHKVLQQFWLALRDSFALADVAVVESTLHQAIDDNLRQLVRRYPFTLTPQYRQLEQQRLLELLQRWLDIERQRRPFNVLTTEYALDWHWRQLQLNVRLDRVDHAEHGLVIVDYKTGKVAGADWQSERPRDPQLWLYQAALQQKTPDEPVSGLLHARISLEQVDYSGITEHDEGFDELRFAAHKAVAAADWAGLQRHWQQVLGSLADEYLQGLVTVAPQFATSCQYCHLHALCRIAELRRQQELDA
ncbi:MAG TPA: PD-(D/E)XK nuclease family protein [Candidatus Acidoferrum sp.]|nr:PD-(D/E)XK nuclease family protein [Candidatus Acidoferrum sp.]